MFIEDMRLGMKVIPQSRTVNNKMHDVSHSVIWRKALDLKQSYLYIVQIDVHKERALCNIVNCLGGDYFMEYDLEPLEESS